MYKFKRIFSKKDILLISIAFLLHIIIFLILFSIFGRTTVASTGIIWAALLGWNYGKYLGILFSVFLFTITAVCIYVIDPEMFSTLVFRVDPYAGSLLQLFVGFASGAISDLVHQLRDEIAYRKKVENELNSYKINLEDLVQKRTNELNIANEYLRQAEKMDALGQLTSGIAHDFKNILLGINGYASMIKKKTINDPSLQKYSSKILEASEQVSKLISNMLSFSRKETHGMSPLNVHNTIRDTIHLLEHSLDKNIVLSCALNAQSPEILGDSAQIQNVLLNMGINAKDAMPQGGRLIYRTQNEVLNENDTLVKVSKLSPGEYIVISIEDSGSGISESILNKIFEPFFTTKEKGKGTGMGLATSYSTIKEHNGLIGVTSQIGQGTTFKIYLPVISSSKEAPVVSESVAGG